MPEMLEPLKLVSQVAVSGLTWVLGTESTSALHPCHVVLPHSPASAWITGMHGHADLSHPFECFYLIFSTFFLRGLRIDALLCF